MKPIRYISASVAMALIVVVSLTSCAGKSKSHSRSNQQQVVVEESKNDIAVNDSPENNIAYSISDFAKDLNTLQEQVSEIQSNEKWWWIFSGASVLAILLATICLYSNDTVKEKLEQTKKDINKLAQYNNRQELAKKPTVYTNTMPFDNKPSLERRVAELEKKIQQLTSPSIAVQPSVSHSTPEMVKNGYFGNPVNNDAEPYFKKLLTSKDSDARFTVEVSGNKATFKPLDIPGSPGTFRSSDALRAAVNFTEISTASSHMQVNAPGEAELRDNKWLITKKAKITFS